MNTNKDIVISRIKLYLYFVICFVLSVIIIGVADSNNLQINSMFIFVISLVIISLYLLERFSSQKILLDSNVDLSENTTNKIELEETHEVNLKIPQEASSKADNLNYIKLREGFNNLSGEFKILRQDIEKKEKEISRYKDGYDASKLKNYFSKFTYLDSLIKGYINENHIDLKGLNDIQTQMEEALAEYDIEIFYPKLGDDYRTSKGVLDVTERNKIDTMDRDQHFNIAEVIEPGYRRKIDLNLDDGEDSNYQIISKATVSIYVFKTTEFTNN